MITPPSVDSRGMRGLSAPTDAMAIPHNETREDGVESVRITCDVAERHDRLLDRHIDETDDPNTRFTEVLARH